MLVLLIIPVVIATWEFIRRGHPVNLPFDHSNATHNTLIERLIAFANILPAMLLAVVVFILASPKRMGKAGQERLLTNIQFCLDVSGSMTSEFGEGTQYDAAVECIRKFAAHRKGDAFGLTIFGTDFLHWVPLTKDLSAISLCTPFLRPDQLPQQFGGTAIGKALRACLAVLSERPEGDKMVILISDGESADLGEKATDEVAQELFDEDVVVYAIHVGEREIPNDLHRITDKTGGRTYAASDATVLRDVFDHIDKMKPIRMKSGASRPVDFYRPFAIAGLVVLVAHIATLYGLRYTPW